jgi:drug/metabolite transporter (DMT)-like permease
MWLGGDRLNALQWLGAAIMLLSVLAVEVMPRMARE